MLAALKKKYRRAYRKDKPDFSKRHSELIEHYENELNVQNCKFYNFKSFLQTEALMMAHEDVKREIDEYFDSSEKHLLHIYGVYFFIFGVVSIVGLFFLISFGPIV